MSRASTLVRLPIGLSGDASGNITSTGTINTLTVGRGAGSVSTNTAVGASALAANTTGASNSAFGDSALAANTTGSNNQAFGRGALSLNIDGGQNIAVGRLALGANTNGPSNTAVGHTTLTANTTGGYNTAVGQSALGANTTASNNTAVGYQAGYANTTGVNLAAFGNKAGYVSTGNNNTYIGAEAGLAATSGTFNSFLGYGAGYLVTTGGKNTIIGAYSGNQGGLDIRTASNNIVLSDGDGVPVYFGQYTGYTFIGAGSRSADGGVILMGTATSGQGPCVVGSVGAHGSRADKWYAGSNSFVKGGTTYDTYTVMAGTGGGGVNLTSGATSWTSASDERLKDIIEPITDAANKVATLRAVIGKYKTDEEGKRRSFLIAQDVQAVLPEAVVEGRNSKDDDNEYLHLAYTEVIPLLVAAIKELKAEIDTLKGQA